MKTLGIALVVNMGTVAAIVCATVAALHGVAGWGWFLLIAVLVSKSWSSSEGRTDA